MEFCKYPSIENSYREKFVSLVQGHPDFYGMKWQVTEKIHGANFSFVVDRESGEVRVGKRSGLTNGEFYACQSVVDRYHDNVLALVNDSVFGGCRTVQVFGELFGAGVQKGVLYSGEKGFAAFDIRFVKNDGIWDFMSTTPVETLCRLHGIPHVPVLNSCCTFEEAMAFDVDFNSVIADRDDNQAEGVVIKPTSALFLHGGSRVILKKKSDKFKERSKSKKVRVRESFTEEMMTVLGSMLDYMTENRLRNVVSHVGEVTNKDFGKLLGLYQQDLLEEWAKDNGWGELEKQQRKAITKDLNRKSGVLIRQHFLNIIDGEY